MSRQEESSPEFRCNWRDASYATNADRIPGKKERARIPRNADPLLCKHPAAYTFEHATSTGTEFQALPSPANWGNGR
jgi:hypothetical protein